MEAATGGAFLLLLSLHFFVMTLINELIWKNKAGQPMPAQTTEATQSLTVSRN